MLSIVDFRPCRGLLASRFGLPYGIVIFLFHAFAMHNTWCLLSCMEWDVILAAFFFQNSICHLLPHSFFLCVACVCCSRVGIGNLPIVFVPPNTLSNGMFCAFLPHFLGCGYDYRIYVYCACYANWDCKMC